MWRADILPCKTTEVDSKLCLSFGHWGRRTGFALPVCRSRCNLDRAHFPSICGCVGCFARASCSTIVTSVTLYDRVQDQSLITQAHWQSSHVRLSRHSNAPGGAAVSKCRSAVGRHCNESRGMFKVLVSKMISRGNQPNLRLMTYERYQNNKS
jgi:hypothetical protein